MNGVDITSSASLASYMGCVGCLLFPVIGFALYGASTVGFVLSFFRRFRWLALVLGLAPFVTIAIICLTTGGAGEGFVEAIKRFVLDWRVDWNGSIREWAKPLGKMSILFGLITVVRVCYLHWKERKTPREP